MLIHWYVPYSFGGAQLAASRPGDEVVVQALRTRFGQPLSTSGPAEVVRDLPEANDRQRSRSVWVRAPQRAALYAERARARHRLVSSRPFDVSCQFHLNHRVDAVALPFLAKRTAIVSFVHDVYPHETRLGDPLERRLLGHTYRHAGELIVFHDVLRDMLVADFDVEPDRVHVVPIGITLRDVASDDRRSGRPPRLLFFGRLRANKGVEVLCDALELLGPRSDFEVVFAGAGDGPLAARVADVAAQFDHVTARIDFVPWGEVDDLFAAADVLLLPYTSFASQSGVLRDAYGRGRPMIVSDVGALGPTVRDDGTGAVAPPGDADALASAIDTIAARPEQLSVWRANVMSARDRHAPEVVGQRVRQIIDVAVERHAVEPVEARS